MRLAIGSADPDQLRAEVLYWRAAATVLAVTVAVGVLQAVLWSRIAPGEQYQVTAAGQPIKLPTESFHQFTSIAIFLLLGAVAGVFLATLTWHWRRVRSPVLLVTVVGANALGALTAYLLSRLLAPGVDPTAVGSSAADSLVTAPPTLGNAMVIILQPALAVALYTFLVLWNGRPDLGTTGER